MAAASWWSTIRLVLITDGEMTTPEIVAARVAAAAERLPASVAMVQLRARARDGGAVLALARAAIAASRGRLPVVVNDRLDVALAARAAGVHLPEAGLSLADARALAPAGFAIGCSRHTIEGVAAAAANGADWVQLGPVFETPGKPAPIGLPALRDAAAAIAGAATTRLVAVGGISDHARAAACRAAGAPAIAAIRAAWTPAIASLA